jgi:hypothetical protein
MRLSQPKQGKANQAADLSIGRIHSAGQRLITCRNSSPDRYRRSSMRKWRDPFLIEKIIIVDEPFFPVVRPKDVELEREFPNQRRRSMRKFNWKITAIALVVAAAAATTTSVTPAAAFGFGKFGGGGFGGKFGGGGFHSHWGWAGYRGYGGYYGGCVLKRYYDEDGEVVVFRVCY